MAILFTNQLTQDRFIHAFNDFGVVFNADGGTPIKADIEIDGIIVTITPNPEGKFRYNFKKLFSQVLSVSGFNDNIQPDLDNNPNQYVYTDNSGFKEVTAIYTVTYDNENTETVNIDYMLMRSVLQIEDLKRGMDNSLNSELALMLPFTTRSIKNYWASYFQGYPFDVSIWSDDARTVTVKNTKSQLSTTINVVKGINRFFISFGSSNLSFDNVLPTYNGLNELEFTIDGVVAFTLHLMKYEIGCGEYIKWLNSSGHWSYFLFYNTRTQRQSRPFEPITNLSFIDDSNSNLISQGVEVNDGLDLLAGNVQNFEKVLLNDIMASAKVYRYLGDNYQDIDTSKWIEEQMDATRQLIFQNKRYFWEVELQLNKNQVQTITP